MGRIITLTTDFGWRDGYVGAMKGVILSINPEANVVDICHDIEPQNVAQAAFVLGTTYRYFPPGTIHVVVVDPGVGTERKALLLETATCLFLGPDNGVLTSIVEAGPAYRAFELSNSRYWRKPVSHTFHGRDIFASVAGYLSQGIAPGEFGEVVASVVTLSLPRPVRKGGVLLGEVIHVDSFGNLVTNIRESELPQGSLEVEVGEATIAGLSRSYAAGGELLAIVGSSGNLEIAARNGSAAARLGAGMGQKVVLRIRNPEVSHA